VADVSRETKGARLASFTGNSDRAICNYEGTSYRAEFWEGRGREFEDLAERIALRRLLPARGQRLVDIGAGFGRLADLYDGYEQVVLLDYATSGLREAQARLGRSGRFIYVAANIYQFPLAPATCDTAVSVRVLHHLSDVPAALRAIARSVRPGGHYVLEYANKRNLKAIVRYLVRRQTWSPFTVEPYEFTNLNFDFHPTWMAHTLTEAGFRVSAQLAVSHFRQPLLKRLIPARTLAAIDGLVQRPGAALKLAPSVFLRTEKVGNGTGPVDSQELFACPTCGPAAEGKTSAGAGATVWAETAEELICQRCGARWPVHDGIYDFRQAVG
jgi:SAM-dependent methyltransferase